MIPDAKGMFWSTSLISYSCTFNVFTGVVDRLRADFLTGMGRLERRRQYIKKTHRHQSEEAQFIKHEKSDRKVPETRGLSAPKADMES